VSKIPLPPPSLSKAEKIFKNEFKLIKNKKIKKFVIEVFKQFCPDYFWTVPCSTTGKYHPQLALGKNGLLRHVKLAVYWGIELARAFELEKLQDEIVATLLLHDLIKNGKGLDSNGRSLESGVTGTHGVTLANKINSFDCEAYLDKNDGFYRICAGIAGHMGIWTTDSKFRPNNLENPEIKEFAQLIHLADYCASRKVDEIIKSLEQEKLEEDENGESPNTKN